MKSTFQGCNISDGEPATAAVRSGATQQHSSSIYNRRLRYERSVSPPRSSSSSGYGTGSSSRSFSQGPAAVVVKDRFPANPEGTSTSTSSGHSSDDPWYDFMPDLNDQDGSAVGKEGDSALSPPPLPSRQGLFADRVRLRPGGQSGDNVGGNVKMPVSQSAAAAAANTTAEKMKAGRSNDHVFQINGDSPTKTAPASAYSTPPRSKQLLESPSLVGRANNYEELRRVHSVCSPAAPQEALKLESANKVRPPNPPDYHHAMQSRLVALKSANLPAEHLKVNRHSPSLASRSEDELSAGSANSLSPRSRRRHQANSSAGTLTPSSGSSRNHSPRLLVEAKLKTNGGSSSGSSNGSKNGQRCSTNLQVCCLLFPLHTLSL